MPQVSVIMPVRDGARWIAASLDSVLAQSFADFELIVVDDGSSDTTRAIVREHAARDPRINLLAQPARGLVAALNAGLQAAQGDLIARLDADDLAEPGRFAAQVATMLREPGLVLLGSSATEIDETGATCGQRTALTDRARLRQALQRGNPMIHSSVMMRAQAVRRVGGYRPFFIAAEDDDLWLRLAEHGEIGNLSAPLVRYRVHPGGVSANKQATQMLSSRLARVAARHRRQGSPDPADGLALPVDLWAAPPQPFAGDIALYRMLAWAEPGPIPSRLRDIAIDPGLLARADLTRRERRLAQEAILRYLRAVPDAPRAGLLLRLIALRPLRAPQVLMRALRGAASPQD